MTNGIFGFSNNTAKSKFILTVIAGVVSSYNKTVYKYTKEFKGKIPVPTQDIRNIPKKFMTVEEYLNSKAIWKAIRRFLKEKGDIDTDDYLDVMVKNWHDLAVCINMIDRKSPLPAIIFSTKFIPKYYQYKKIETQTEEMNKHLALKRGEDYYRLSPSLQSNINSLFRLKEINPDMSYHEIVTIFVGEFEDNFKNVVMSMEDDEITEDKLASIFK